MKERKRCAWCNPKNPSYIQYHDNEWGILRTDDRYLYEMLILESFQAGLSWECVLNKREALRLAFDGFQIDRVCDYDEDKINALLADKAIIRNKLKIKAAVNNSRIFRSIVSEYGSFYAYLRTFCKDTVLYETGKTTNALSDALAKDLQSRGMKFVGSTTMYAYLQAVGLIYAHEQDCFLYRR